MSRSAKTLILVNPTSGRGRSGRLYPFIQDFLRVRRYPADFVVCPSSQEMEQRAASASSEGYSAIAAMGGDGTFHFVLRGAFGTDIAFGILPTGTGNDIALGLGIPRDPFAAAEILTRCSPRPVDLLRARFANGTSHVFIGAGGAGLDAEANRIANTRFAHLPGAARYVAAALAALKSWQPLHLTAEIDDRSWRGPVLFAAVANSPTYGAGIYIAPDASMQDGWMDITLVGVLPFSRVLEALPVILRDGNLRWPEIHRFRARRLFLRTDRSTWFHGDGELLGELPVEIEVLPSAARMIAPPVNPRHP